MIGVMKYVGSGINHFSWEEGALRAIEQGTFKFSTAVWLQTFGSDFMLLLLTMVAAGIAVWHDRPLLGISILLSLVVTDAVVRVGWLALVRHRPDIIAQGMASPGFHSFPSGHSAKTVAIYGLLIAQWIAISKSRSERIAAAVFGSVICLVVPLARLRMGVHWPTDVMAGILLGVVWLGFVISALKYERFS
jgi:membrane-associated phospholipid phosphatase